MQAVTLPPHTNWRRQWEIEPILAGLEPAVLPLHYTIIFNWRICFKPNVRLVRIRLIYVALNHSARTKNLYFFTVKGFSIQSDTNSGIITTFRLVPLSEKSVNVDTNLSHP